MIGSGTLGGAPLGGSTSTPGSALEVAITYEITEPLALIKQTGEGLCMREITIRQGDSLALKYGLGDTELYDWACKIAVKANLSDTEALHEQEVETYSEDGLFFESLITRTVTVEWAPGSSYYVIADLYNETTGQAKEFQSVVIVTEQGLTQDD